VVGGQDALKTALAIPGQASRRVGWGATSRLSSRPRRVYGEEPAAASRKGGNDRGKSEAPPGPKKPRGREAT
jgi:hypothetical protein